MSRFAQHPHAQIITSIDGLGPILGAELLADTAVTWSARSAPRTGWPPTLVWPPYRVIPGAAREPAPPQRYHRGLRRVFYLAAFSAIKPPDGPSRAYSQRKGAEGTRHVPALVALARQLVNLVWALIRDNRMFTTEAPTQAATAA